MIFIYIEGHNKACTKNCKFLINGKHIFTDVLEHMLN